MLTAELQTNVTASAAETALRRIDLDTKQELVAKLLHDCHCEGLLILHPANFRWLTAGANALGLVGRDELPALYFSANHRWLLANSMDTQRFLPQYRLRGLFIISQSLEIISITHGRRLGRWWNLADDENGFTKSDILFQPNRTRAR